MSTEVKQAKMISFCSAAHWRSVLCVVEMAIARPDDLVIAIDPTGLMKKMFELRGKTDVVYLSSTEITNYIDEVRHRRERNGMQITVVVDYTDGDVWEFDHSLYSANHVDVVRNRLKGRFGISLCNDVHNGRVVFFHIDKLNDQIANEYRTFQYWNQLVLTVATHRQHRESTVNTTIVSNDKFVSRAIRNKYGKCGEYKVLPNYIPNMVDENNILLEHLHPLLTLPEVLEQKHV